MSWALKYNNNTYACDLTGVVYTKRNKGQRICQFFEKNNHKLLSCNRKNRNIYRFNIVPYRLELSRLIHLLDTESLRHTVVVPAIMAKLSTTLLKHPMP